MINKINLSSEQIALISVIVTLLIYILGKHNELKFKKHELKKDISNTRKLTCNRLED